MNKVYYAYDSNNKKYIKTIISPNKDDKKNYGLTNLKPPIIPNNYKAIFDINNKKWNIVEDLSKKIMYNKNTKEEKIYENILYDDLVNYTDIKPPSDKAFWTEAINNWEIPPLTNEEKEEKSYQIVITQYPIYKQLSLINKALQSLKNLDPDLPNEYTDYLQSIDNIKNTL